MKDFSPLAITEAAVGFPVRLCVITRTDGTVYRIAESDETVTVAPHDYLVVPGLNISAIRHTGNGEMPSCQITAVHSTSATFATADLDAGLFDGAAVQIYVADSSNPTRAGLAFTGAIAGMTYSVENSVVLDVKGPANGARILMTQKRSPMCRTDLFSTLCAVDKTLYDQATTVATIPTAFSFTVTGALAQATDYFNQGVIVTSTGKGIVIGSWNQSTQTIVTYLPCSQLLTVGQSLTLYPGCDKTLGAAGCARFSNQLNFQGEPHFTGTAAAAQQV